MLNHKTLLTALLLLAATPLASFAACSSPEGEEGAVIYNSTAKMLQFCNGTVWVNAAGIAAGAGGGGSYTLYDADGAELGVVLGTPGGGYVSFYDTTTDRFHVSDVATSSTSAYSGGTVYFSEANCEGAPVGLDAANRHSYACTGSTNCTKRPVYSINGPLGPTPHKSYRASNGTCYGHTSSTSLYKFYYICGGGTCTLQ
jgi:hypothetical protein